MTFLFIILKIIYILKCSRSSKFIKLFVGLQRITKESGGGNWVQKAHMIAQRQGHQKTCASWYLR